MFSAPKHVPKSINGVYGSSKMEGTQKRGRKLDILVKAHFPLI
jgi:hypothetical protein